MGDCVPIEEWAGELMYIASLTYLGRVGVVKARVNSPIEQYVLDPKPSELSMSRMKTIERLLEVRTH